MNVTREAAYEILKLSLQVARDHGKIDICTIEDMLSEIESEFEKNEWSKKRISTPDSSPLKKKRKHEVIFKSYFPVIIHTCVIDIFFW